MFYLQEISFTSRNIQKCDFTTSSLKPCHLAYHLRMLQSQGTVLTCVGVGRLAGLHCIVAKVRIVLEYFPLPWSKAQSGSWGSLDLCLHFSRRMSECLAAQPSDRGLGSGLMARSWLHPFLWTIPSKGPPSLCPSHLFPIPKWPCAGLIWQTQDRLTWWSLRHCWTDIADYTGPVRLCLAQLNLMALCGSTGLTQTTCLGPAEG